MKRVDIFDASYTAHLGSASLHQVYKEGLWHQSAHAWIFNPAGEIVFQLRSQEIVNYPNRLGVSAGGCVDLGDAPLDTIIRETNEELGLRIDDREIISVGYRVCQSQNESRIYNVFDNLFLINHDAPLSEYNIQESELGGVFTVSYADAAKFFNNEVGNIVLRGFTLENGERKWGEVVARIENFVPFRACYFKHMLGIIGKILNTSSYNSFTYVKSMFQNHKKRIIPIPSMIHPRAI